MKRRFFIVLFLIFLFICKTVPAQASFSEPATISLEEAMEGANNELNKTYYIPIAQVPVNGTKKTLELNRQIWDSKSILVYGGPEDVPQQASKDYKNGEWRYLGYTIEGNIVSNPDFPPDHKTGTLINDWDWKTEPWLEPFSTERNKWDGLEENLPFIKAALNRDYNNPDYPNQNKYDPSLKPRNARGEGQDWHTVTKILQPRTQYTPGFARMWHYSGGSWWYITIFLPSTLEPDIEVTSINNANPVYVGTQQSTIVNYRNNSDKEQTFQALFIVGNDTVQNETITLAAGQSTNRSYQWTTPEEPGQIIIKAQVLPVPGEKTLANNVKTLTIEVKEEPQAKKPVTLPCDDKPSITNSWDVVYTWKVFHEDIREETDKNGKKVLVDYSWWETKYELVEYTEILSATLTINTKQGISTDPKRPKESDRESRGSWEIIPYAKKKGLDPNEVTRAGYGFEVKLETAYSNDWETKVPAGAAPFGGTYTGPQKATVEFYDTKGRFVERVELVPTQGKAGDKHIIWELPREKYSFQDGTTIYERKHYVDLKTPDGKYEVVVTVSGAGRTGLCLVRQKYVTIYGDMYDDDYTRVARANE